MTGRGEGCGHVDDALRAPARPVDNAGALPTARAFDHMPTACDYDEIKTKRNRGPQTTRAASSLPHRIGALAGYQMRHKGGGELQFNVTYNNSHEAYGTTKLALGRPK